MGNNFFNSLKEYEGMKPGLVRIKKFLNEVDNPQDKIKIIHIAGTNGKGSTAVFMFNLLKANGCKVGLYTSPHLCEINERIKINDKNISNADFKNISTGYVSLANKYKLSYFEYLTAIAFIYFYEKKVDFAVMETGLGGRFDATNIVKKPLACIITSISFDHSEILGNSISQIAFEKAGIIKKGVPVIVGKLPKDAIEVINKKSKPLVFGRDFKIKNVSLSGFDYIGKNKFSSLKTSLIGFHQARNASIAVFTYELLSKQFNFDLNKIRTALLNAHWDARFSIFDKFIVDGAHNKESLNSFFKTLNAYSKLKKHCFVFSMMREKDYKFAVKKISQYANKVILFSLKKERALKNEVLKKEFLKYLKPNRIFEIRNFNELKTFKEKEIIIVGSLYLAGEFIKFTGGKK